MEKYQVWEVVPRRKAARILKARWVFTRKIDGDTGKPKAHKARWVAKGYSQIHGIDYNELYAGVAHKDSIRLLLAIANHRNMEIDQVDIKAAFLNGVLKEEIYMEPPKGSDINSDQMLRLKKALYGLKQSPRCFNEKLSSWLISRGFKATLADSCTFICRKGDILLILSVHVDDQLIACDSRRDLDKFKKDLNDNFECTDGGPASYFLGFNIFRDRPNRKLWISQEHYLTSVLERFDMLHCKPSKVPLPGGFKPTAATDEEHALAKHKPYQAMVGALLYAATITRPDIAFSTSLLARHASKWNLSHVHAAKNLLRYI